MVALRFRNAPVTADTGPACSPYDMDAAFMSFQVHGSGIHALSVLAGSGRGLPDGAEQVGASGGERGAVPGQQPTGEEDDALGGELLRAVGPSSRSGPHLCHSDTTRTRIFWHECHIHADTAT